MHHFHNNWRTPVFTSVYYNGVEWKPALVRWNSWHPCNQLMHPRLIFSLTIYIIESITCREYIHLITQYANVGSEWRKIDHFGTLTVIYRLEDGIIYTPRDVDDPKEGAMYFRTKQILIAAVTNLMLQCLHLIFKPFSIAII